MLSLPKSTQSERIDLLRSRVFLSIQFPSDPCLLSTPEYAFGVPGSLKNALDWTVSSDDFWGKPVAVVSASSSATGGDKAHAALLLTLTTLGARVPERAKLMVPAVNKKLNANITKGI